MTTTSAIRNFAFRVRHGFRGAPIEILGRGFRLDESLRRWGVGNEEPVLRAIAGLLRPGDAFVDVGANFGLHTLVGASCVGERGAVVAVEPVPGNCALLRRNVALNGFDRRVAIVQKAATEVAGEEVTLHGVIDGVSIAASIRPHEGFGTDLAVKTTTLDDCVAALDAPLRLVKIDVEGAEHRVVRGASRTLRERRPILLVEVHEFALPDFGTSVAEFRDHLAGFGYEEERIDSAEGPEGRYYHALFHPRPPAA
jgi:FkbM family methyltransferase